MEFVAQFSEINGQFNANMGDFIRGPQGPQGEKGETGPQGPSGKDAPQDAVRYGVQALDDAQQEQARGNIGAASAGEVSQLKDDLDDTLNAIFNIAETTEAVEFTTEAKQPFGNVGSTLTFQNSNKFTAMFTPEFGKTYNLSFYQITFSEDYGIHAVFLTDENNTILRTYEGISEVQSSWVKCNIDITIDTPVKYVYVFTQSLSHVSIKKYIQIKDSKISQLEESLKDIENDNKVFKDKGAILFSFDAMNLTDGRLSIFDEYGYVATAQTGHTTETIIESKLEIIKELRKHGWDIGTYENTNCPIFVYGRDIACAENPTDEVVEAWDNYVSNAVKGEKAHGIFYPIVWHSTQNVVCNTFINALKKHGYRMVRGNNLNINYEDMSPYFTEDFSFCTSLVLVSPNNIDTVKSSIDYAVTNKVGLCLCSHGIYATEEEANANYAMTESCLREVLDYIKSYVDNGQLEVITYHELYSRYFGDDSKELDYKRSMANIGYLSN